MVDTDPSFEIRLESCVALLGLRKREKKNVDEIFETLGVLFKLVVEEKPVLDEAGSCGIYSCPSRALLNIDDYPILLIICLFPICTREFG